MKTVRDIARELEAVAGEFSAEFDLTSAAQHVVGEFYEWHPWGGFLLVDPEGLTQWLESGEMENFPAEDETV